VNLSGLARGELARILPWVLPPLLGAVIGYVTNAIAIRMLFRPLTEKRLFGIRIPFTPGVIPRQRSQLADSIGAMVSRELLDETTVRRQIVSAGFYERIRQNIHGFLGDLFASPLRSLDIGNRELVFSSVETFLGEALYSFFSSRSFIHGVRTILARLVSSLVDRPVGELLGGGRAAGFVAERLLPALAEADTRRRIAGSLRRWLEERRLSGEPLGGLLPRELIGTIGTVARSLLPSILDAAFRWLNQPETRRELNTRGKRLLREALDRLNVLQRFLISAGQFDRTLENRMPQIVDDALAALRDYAYNPETLEQVRRVVEDGLESWRSRPAPPEEAALDPQVLAGAVEKALQRLGEEPLRTRAAQALEKLFAGRRERTLRELLGRWLHVQEEDVVEFAAQRVLGYLARRETSRAIAAEVLSFSRRFVEENQERTLGELLHVGPALHEKISATLTERLIRIVDRRLPSLIESFDVRALVVDKINNLDVGQVEKLLMMVIARHLKWINIFGGILGAIIGLSQMLLRLIA
jgi:uncharacterized membrane protein YheB (UPF0754 family)